jgi:FkbM family methyltransferase
MNRQKMTVSDVFEKIANDNSAHIPGTKQYAEIKHLADSVVKPLFLDTDDSETAFGPFGLLSFPFHSMGNVTSLNLFDIDELILFAFYHSKRTVYKKVLDLGANIGLHTLLMSRCDFEVIAVEPDPDHFKILEKNTLKNCPPPGPRLLQAAVSDRNGEATFVRVHGNTTSSHLAGMKPSAYGDLSRFSVPTVDIRDLVSGIDFIKMDVEGHEVTVLSRLEAQDFQAIDIMMEIGSAANRDLVYEIAMKNNLHCCPQKTGWKPSQSIDDLPTSYKEGSLFLSSTKTTPW